MMILLIVAGQERCCLASLELSNCHITIKSRVCRNQYFWYTFCVPANHLIRILQL